MLSSLVDVVQFGNVIRIAAAERLADHSVDAIPPPPQTRKWASAVCNEQQQYWNFADAQLSFFASNQYLRNVVPRRGENVKFHGLRLSLPLDCYSFI